MARPSKYTAELHEPAVRMVLESRADYPSEYEAIRSIATKLGITSPESLRKWVRRAEVDVGARPGKTTDEIAEIKKLKQENAELSKAGVVGYACFTGGNVLELFGVAGAGVVGAVPGLFELTFAIWLIARGFASTPTVRSPATT